MVDAIVLAGGSAETFSGDDSTGKGLLKINGRPMVDYVVQALLASPSVDRVAVVMPGEIAWQDHRILAINSPCSSITESIEAGLKVLLESGNEHLLLVSADIPLLSVEAVDDFIERASKTGADICYPIIPKEAVTERFPDSKRTYARLREGVFTGGNMGMFSKRLLIEKLSLFESFYRNRKSPVKLARILGLSFIMSYMLGIISVAGIEKRMSEILGASGRAIITSFSEVGFDVDKPPDLEAAASDIGLGLTS